MTNFFYSGNDRENERFVIRHYHSYYGGDKREYENANTNADCDFCHDLYERTQLLYVAPAFDNNEDPEKITWTVKLCCPCLNVIIKDQDIRNFKRLGICKEEVDSWEQLKKEK